MISDPDEISGRCSASVPSTDPWAMGLRPKTPSSASRQVPSDPLNSLTPVASWKYPPAHSFRSLLAHSLKNRLAACKLKALARTDHIRQCCLEPCPRCASRSGKRDAPRVDDQPG